MSGAPTPSPFQATQTFAWDDPVDVASINRDVSDLVLHRIAEVRAASRGEAVVRSSATLVLGPAGSGKTHLFTRLRRREGPRAVFVHSRPEIGADPAPRNVLGAIVDALRQPVLGDDHQQIDVIVGAMLAALEGRPHNQCFLLLHDWERLPADEREAQIERAVERAAARYPEIRPEYLERLLAVPFASKQERRALFSWLGGREPSDVELARARARTALVDGDVLPALRTLGVAASFGAPIVLVFDQLENLDDDTGSHRIIAYARVVTELRDTVRGLVLVQMALNEKWTERIHPVLGQSDRDRIEETVKHLSMPTAAERRALVERWTEALPAEERGAPFPAPFSAEEIERWTRSPMTPRMLMQTCGDAYAKARSPFQRSLPIDGAGPEPVVEVEPPEERLELHWASALDKARREIDDASQQSRGVDAERIAGGLITALRLLGRRAAPAPRKHLVALRLDGGRVEEVLLAQHLRANSMAAAVRAATELATDQRVLLAREHALAIPPTWKEVDALLRAYDQMGRQASIGREDLARLLALHDFLGAARSQDLSAADGRPIAHADAEAWARAALDCAGWEIVEAVLGAAPAPTAPTPTPPTSDPGPAPPQRSARAPSPAPAAAPASSPAFTVIERLRVASLDRLVREARALDPSATRATVMAELAALPVKIFGGSIVALREAP